MGYGVPILKHFRVPFIQDETLRTRKKEREDLGVELYGIQQELARFQMMLEKRHDEFSDVQQVRQQEEQQLTDVQNMYKDLQFKANQEKKKSMFVLHFTTCINNFFSWDK